MQFRRNTPNIYPYLNDQFRLNKINEIKDYFVTKIKEGELMSKGLSKYLASFDYFDKSLIVSSATSGSISNELFATVIGAAVGIPSAGFSFSIFDFCRNCQKTLKNNTKYKEKTQQNWYVS